jgi:hypothetical protein
LSLIILAYFTSDRIRVLNDSLSANGIKTIHVTLPIRVDNLKHAGYPIIHKIVKYWLGNISFEILEADSCEGRSNLRVGGLTFDPALATWYIVAVKKDCDLIWHPSEFSKDKNLEQISRLLASPPNSYLQTVRPVNIAVGERFTLKAHLSFRLWGFVSIPPCTVWFDIDICKYGEVRFKLKDVTGVAGRAARFVMPTTMQVCYMYFIT